MKTLPLLVLLLLLTGASVGYYEEVEHDCLCGMEREGPSITFTHQFFGDYTVNKFKNKF